MLLTIIPIAIERHSGSDRHVGRDGSEDDAPPNGAQREDRRRDERRDTSSSAEFDSEITAQISDGRLAAQRPHEEPGAQHNAERTLPIQSHVRLVGGGEIEQVEQLGECLVGIAAGQAHQVAHLDRALERGASAIEQVVDRNERRVIERRRRCERCLIELGEAGDARLEELRKLRPRSA